MMTLIDFTLQQTAWLFTRGQESVRLVIQAGPIGCQLAVFGPGNAIAEYDFAVLTELQQFRKTFEQQLVSRGFLNQAAAERRRSADRHQMLRTSSCDRRRTS
jgi:hypothetical protein